MANYDLRGELYRGWIVVPIPAEDIFFYEFHSPEGYRNMNLKPFESPEDAIACARDEIDQIIEIFEQAI
jgi:hypothetical protein